MTLRHLFTASLIAITSIHFVTAAERPAALLQSARERMDSRPWKVDALVQGQDGFKVYGIVLGQDFDLTVQGNEGESRQIAIGEQSWTSTDQGKTWNKNSTVDRRYFFLVRAPIRFKAEEKIPAFESVGQSKEDGEELTHIRFKARDKVSYEGDRPNHWLIIDKGKPIGIRRYAGPLVLNNDYVTAQVRYESVDDAKPILPPPGNPAALPKVDVATVALGRALDAMQKGLWDVKATITASKSVVVRGLIQGEDFDLAMEPQTDGETIRQIVIKDQAWSTKDGGKTWKKADASDRLIYRWVHSPIRPSNNLPPFEIAGKETRDSESLLHLRLKVSEKLKAEKDRPHYWLVLDSSDQAGSVRRYEGDLVAAGGQVIRCEADYRPAPAGASINPPAPNLIKAEAAALLPAPVSEEALGFFDIEERKAKLDGRIVPVEITGQVIQSQPIGANQFRLMVKDTDQHYGLVEISREGMETLGLTGKGASKPLTLYLRITHLGAKPAARATAVGTRFVPSNKKEGTYSWE